MKNNRKPTHIIVTNLNQLRRLTPKQIHISNVFPYDAANIEFFNTNNVPYQLAIKNWGRYEVISD